MVMGGGITLACYMDEFQAAGDKRPASESRPYKSAAESAHEATGGDYAAESGDEGNIGKTGDGDSAEPPVAVMGFFTEKPWIRPRRAAIEDGGHDAPFDPADGHINGDVGDCIFGKADSDMRDERAAEEVDQNSEEKAHEQSQDAEANRLCGQKFRFGLKQAQADVAPDAIRYKLDDEIERAVECSHGGIFPIRRYSQADDASAISEIEDARLGPSASLGIKRRALQERLLARTVGISRRDRQYTSEGLAGVGLFGAGDLFGRALRDDAATAFAAFRAKIDDPVSLFDDVEIVLDD